MSYIISNQETAIFQTWLMKYRSEAIVSKVKQAVENWEPNDARWDDEFGDQPFDILEVVMDVILEEPTPEFTDGTLYNCAVGSNDDSLTDEVLWPLLQLAARRIEPGCIALAFLEEHKELSDLVPGQRPDAVDQPVTGIDTRSIQLD